MIRNLAGLLTLITLTFALGGCVVIERRSSCEPAYCEGPVWVPDHWR